MSLFLKRWAKLYSDQTPAERALEPAIASLGIPYRCQHPVWRFGSFIDFVLLDDRVAIEVDDASHKRIDRRIKDAERTQKLVAAGWTVVRCTNEEALTDPYRTVDRLMEAAGLPSRTKPRRS